MTTTYPPNQSRGITMRSWAIEIMDRRPDGSTATWEAPEVGPFVLDVANSYARQALARLLAIPTTPGTMRCWRLTMRDANEAFGDVAVIAMGARTGFLPVDEANRLGWVAFERLESMEAWGGGGW